MKNRTLSPVITNDGSYTLFYEELNEHYHSKDGAVGESQYAYIQNGLEKTAEIFDKTINILEVGLGTGLNAILSYKWAIKNNRKIKYIALEPFPIEDDTIKFLCDNTDLFNRNKDVYYQIHNNKNGVELILDDLFKYIFLKKSLEGIEYKKYLNLFHCIYFDAFAPSKQENIWSEANFLSCYKTLKSNGCLVSYCSSGVFKKGLRAAGFKLNRLPGYSSKREMIHSVK